MLSGTDVRIRPVRAADSDLLLRWRNDPATRANAVSQAVVTPEEHRLWFARRLADPECVMYIGERAGKPVGQIRFEIHAGTAEITISVAPGSRGKGYGAELLQEACRAVRRAGQAESFVAYVRPENEASVRLFARKGFRNSGSEQRGSVDLVKMELPGQAADG